MAKKRKRSGSLPKKLKRTAAKKIKRKIKAQQRKVTRKVTKSAGLHTSGKSAEARAAWRKVKEQREAAERAADPVKRREWEHAQRVKAREKAQRDADREARKAQNAAKRQQDRVLMGELTALVESGQRTPAQARRMAKQAGIPLNNANKTRLDKANNRRKTRAKKERDREREKAAKVKAREKARADKIKAAEKAKAKAARRKEWEKREHEREKAQRQPKTPLGQQIKDKLDRRTGGGASAGPIEGPLEDDAAQWAHDEGESDDDYEDYDNLSDLAYEGQDDDLASSYTYSIATITGK